MYHSKMIILIHSSKSMKFPQSLSGDEPQTPLLIDKAKILNNQLKKLDKHQIMKLMKVSDKIAINTLEIIRSWTSLTEHNTPAVESFIGDIYSGLQANKWSNKDKEFANVHLRILSGLYGILRPYDSIKPYRLEMGYKLIFDNYNNLYDFWGSSIVETISTSEIIINLAAEEYSKTITKFINKNRIVTPKFLTINKKTGNATFVVVHAKIARGAFANWLITNRIKDVRELINFKDLGYEFDESISTDNIPVFVSKDFGGIGMSVRLNNQ